jgi:hypothetical protein
MQKIIEFYFKKENTNLIVRSIGRELNEKFTPSLDAVVAYGSNINGNQDDSIIDYILFTNDPKAFFKSFLGHFGLSKKGIRNRLYIAKGYNTPEYHLDCFKIQPNIYMAPGGAGVNGYKFNVVETDKWRSEMSEGKDDWYWYGRFMKVTPVLHMREGFKDTFVRKVAGAIREGIETALILAANEEIESNPVTEEKGAVTVDKEDVMRYYMNLSYICDKRVEPDDKWKKLYEQNPEAYDTFLDIRLNELREMGMIGSTLFGDKIGLMMDPKKIKDRAAVIYARLSAQKQSFGRHNRSNIWTNVYWPEYCWAKIKKWRKR